MERELFWVWCVLAGRMTRMAAHSLLRHLGGYEGVLNASEDAVRSTGILSNETLRGMFDRKTRKSAEEILGRSENAGIKIITYDDARYPKLLRHIYTPPKVLYLYGSLPETEEKCIAVIGSRKSSSYGREMAIQLAFQSVKFGYTVVSGLAKGVDTAAHIGALNGNGRTIAVLGCGVDVCYPMENIKIYKKIFEKGAIISEYPPGEQPRPQYFPARNRIISGIASGVVVVEGGHKSGSLITANHALEQGRQVFAVPGDADKERSYGTNKLIKDGAVPVTGIEDVIPVLEVDYCISYNSENMTGSGELPENISDDERDIIELLKREDLDAEKITAILNRPVNIVNSQLSILELRGLVAFCENRKYRIMLNK